MAVWCGVCATQLSDATENCGSFRGTPELDGVQPGKIENTCTRCHGILAAAVTKAANALSNKQRPAVAALRKKFEEWDARDAAAKSDEADFRREWNARRASKT